MDIGICTSVAKMAEYQGGQINFIEENVQSFLVPEQEEETFREKFKPAMSAHIPISAANCFLPGNLKCTGPDVDIEAILKYARRAFHRASIVGIRTVVFGSGGSRSVPEDFPKQQAREQFIHLLRELGPLAEDNAVTLVIEPLNRAECNFINSVAEGADVVEAASHSNIQLLADIYHMMREDEQPEELLKFGKLLRHVHVAEKETRSAPGVKGDDFRPYFKALKEACYTGPISFECNWDDLLSQLPDSVRTLRAQLLETGLVG